MKLAANGFTPKREGGVNLAERDHELAVGKRDTRHERHGQGVA